jgi:integrase
MGSLKAGKGLPKQMKEKQHRKAMPYADVPAFIAGLHGQMATFGRLALELTALTATRSIETRAAEWSEFDRDAGLWTIPASRMKRGKSHVVPLSKAALAVLERAAALRIEGTNLVFPGNNLGTMSDMTLLKVLRDAKEPYHVHGFRSAFTDWAADRGFPHAVVEAALAHKTPDATQAAYRRTTYLDKRSELMEAWGAFCAAGPGATVVPFKAAKLAAAQ